MFASAFIVTFCLALTYAQNVTQRTKEAVIQLPHRSCDGNMGKVCIPHACEQATCDVQNSTCITDRCGCEARWFVYQSNQTKQFQDVTRKCRDMSNVQDAERNISLGHVSEGVVRATGPAGAIGSAIHLAQSKQPKFQPQQDHDEYAEARSILGTALKIGSKLIGFDGDSNDFADVPLNFHEDASPEYKEVMTRLAKDTQVAKNNLKME